MGGNKLVFHFYQFTSIYNTRQDSAYTCVTRGTGADVNVGYTVFHVFLDEAFNR